MAWSPCPLKRFPGARQPDHRLPVCSHRFRAITPRVTRVRFTPTTARETRHVHRTHHFYRLAALLHRYFAIFRKSALFFCFRPRLFLCLPIVRRPFSLSCLFGYAHAALLFSSYLPSNYRYQSRKFLYRFVYPLQRFLRTSTI